MIFICAPIIYVQILLCRFYCLAFKDNLRYTHTWVVVAVFFVFVLFVFFFALFVSIKENSHNLEVESYVLFGGNF